MELIQSCEMKKELTNPRLCNRWYHDKQNQCITTSESRWNCGDVRDFFGEDPMASTKQFYEAIKQ